MRVSSGGTTWNYAHKESWSIVKLSKIKQIDYVDYIKKFCYVSVMINGKPNSINLWHWDPQPVASFKQKILKTFILMHDIIVLLLCE